MKQYLFVRCNGGHYYRSATACPWDGWSLDGIANARAVFEQLVAGDVARIEVLKQHGVPEDVLRRLLIVEFGSEQSAFDALAPERYVRDGREVLAGELGLELL